MPVVLAYFRRQDIDNPNVAPAQASYLMDKTLAQLSIMTATSSLLTAESSTTGAESSTTSTPVDKPRCTHYIPCHCPSLPEYASPPLGDESSPLWLQKPHKDEDHNKTIIEQTQSSRYRRIAAAWHDAWLAIKISRPLRPPTPLKVRSFRWLISADLIPRGYEDGQAPWRMLIRSYLRDLPFQLTQGSISRKSIFLWQNFPRHLGQLHNRTKLDNAPPEITCGRRAVYSQYSQDYNHSLIGDWLVIVYIWATDKTWLERTDFLDLVSHDSVTGIRAWEFVHAVDNTSTKIPHLFYQCQIRDSVEQDAIYAGHPYQHYNSVQIKPGDPVPARLAGLRRLMNGRARHLYCATYEYETWIAAFESIMSFLTAAPCGMAADLYGRKRILQLSIAGTILAQAFDAILCRVPKTFPIHLVGLKGLWALLGGGNTVLSAMIFTIASDISSDTQSWISISAGFGCLVVSFLIALTLPETRVPGLRSGGPMIASEIRIPSSYNFRLTQFLTSMAGLTHRAFTENKKLGLLILFCLFTTTGSNVPLLVTKPSSQRPGSADIPIYISIFWSSILKLVLLTMILPLTSRFLVEKLRFSPLRRDVSISRASIVVLVAGSLGIAIAKQAQSTKVVAAIYAYALGCGYNPAMHSLLGLLSGGHHVGLLYANISAMQSIGTFIAGQIFGVTIEIVPFIFTVIFLAVVVGALLYLKVRRDRGREADLD
ncbi:hypothetical protein CCMA1212_001430 [Trichoderma ghanense]|uniref:MFS general substrate transporter n=1 Tax=Trichoderma ghanense TaxID=65468 RepID=A0ABY2HBM7_9HYPO